MSGHLACQTGVLRRVSWAFSSKVVVAWAGPCGESYDESLGPSAAKRWSLGSVLREVMWKVPLVLWNALATA